MIRCLRDGLGESKAANFDMKTGSLLLHYILCRVMRSRQTLRNTERMRTDYYYQQGLDKLNKEGDIGYIIKQIRVMRYFLKTVLEKDQRVLLKMKSRDIVTSADENQVDKTSFKKKLNKGKLLERYVETLQKKSPTP